MIDDFSQQVVDILNASERHELKTQEIIEQLINYNPMSNDHKTALATALDILSDNGLIWIESQPAYEKSYEGLISFNNKIISLEDTGEGYSTN